LDTIAYVTRSGLSESLHNGLVVVADSNGAVQLSSQSLEVDRPVFMRSSCKPVQAMALLESGAADHFDLTEPEIAVACASHNGEPDHVSTVQKMLDKGNLSPDQLLCGKHAPYHVPEHETMLKEGRTFNNLHSNCSGKHTGMLLVCKFKGWTTEGYTEPDHPLQQYILQIMSEFAGTTPEKIPLGVDGCTATNFALTLQQMATLFARLATPSYWLNKGDIVRGSAVRRVTRAMMAHPFMVSGTGRNDKDLMETASGRVFSKVGAEGIWCLGFPEKGVGLAIKIEDGNPRPINVIAIEALRQASLLTDEEIELFAEKQVTPIRNMRNMIVGEIRPDFELRKFI
jgi:L-asparaginase II